jgi:hypothetical protein
VGIFVYSYKNTPIYGLLWQFARYKYSFYEYLYYFMREAQQTASQNHESRGFPQISVFGLAQQALQGKETT